MTTLARLPNPLMRCTVRCRLLLPSQWTRNASEPASVNASRNTSGSAIIRWSSSGKRVTRRSDSTIGTPSAMFGTKWPSMTSMWRRSAPACSASATCWPRRAKSAERMDGASFTVIARSSVGRLEDALNRCIQQGVVLRIGLLGRQPLHQRSREARHDAVLPPQALIAFFPCIAARQRHHPHDLGMFDEFGVEVVLLRQSELEHDQLTRWQSVKLLENGRFEQLFGLGFFRAVNIDFRLDYRDQVRADDLPSYLELLGHDVLDARSV